MLTVKNLLILGCSTLLGYSLILQSFELAIPKNNPFYERSLLTISCRDCDYIPKVSNAGQVFIENGKRLQLMHNGIKIPADCYYGSWMTEIIKYLQGHHEPQEEKAFNEILKEIPAGATMIELGSYWAYYSMWFAKTITAAHNYMVEPGKSALKVGQKNFELNNLHGTFINAFIGNTSKTLESGALQTCVDDIIERYQIPYVYMVHSDIQGAEYDMLIGCSHALEQNKIGYFFISTHGNEIHKNCLEFLKAHNFHIIVQHTIHESCSADGLIVARSNLLNGIDSIEVTRIK